MKCLYRSLVMTAGLLLNGEARSAGLLAVLSMSCATLFWLSLAAILVIVFSDFLSVSSSLLSL